MNHVADKFNLRPNIRFNTSVTSARCDDELNLWRATTDVGDVYEAKYLITAVGNMSAANVPEIEGLGTFKNQWYHTGQWPHEGVDFLGKRVGVIGVALARMPLVADSLASGDLVEPLPNMRIDSPLAYWLIVGPRNAARTEVAAFSGWTAKPG